MARYKNQDKLLDAELLARTRFAVISAGAIGSFFVTALSKMGAKDITVFDYDTLEDHNFSNQMHPVSQLGKAKVDSLKATALDYGDCTIKTENRPWTGGEPDTDILVSCVDNMDVRASLFAYYKTRCSLFIDGRMSAFVCKVYGVDTDNADAVTYYESTLHSQALATPAPCGQKSIIFTVLSVSAQMLSQVFMYLNKEHRPTGIVFDLFNNNIDKQYHMELKPQEFVSEEIHEGI